MTWSKDRIGGCLLLAFFLGYGLLSRDITLLPAQQSALFTARTLPYFLTAAGIAGAIWLIALPPRADKPAFAGLYWRRLLGFLTLMSIYGLTLRPLGFLLATGAFLMCGFVVLGERRILWLAGVAIVVAAGFWALMALGLGVYISPWPLFLEAGP